MSNWNLREVMAAMGDAVLMKAGLTPDSPHPMAEQLAERTLAQLAEYAGEMTIAEQGRRPSSERAVMALGLSRADFGMMLGESFRHLASQRFSEFSDHLPLCAALPVRDFNDVEFPDVMAEQNLQLIPESGKYRSSSVVNYGAVKAGLKTYGHVIHISRELVVSDDLQLVNNLFAQFGASAARVENRLVFEALEANPNLQDSAPLFHADLANITVDPLSSASLAKGTSLLRKQPLLRGEPANNKARFLVVSPELELTAKGLNKEQDAGLEVIASPYIKDGRWYLMADPEISPVIHRMILQPGTGSVDPKRSPVDVDPAPKDIAYDGLRMKVRADIGPAITGRIGIIRGGEA